MICGKCGKQIHDGAKACACCGNRVSRPDSKALAVARRVPLSGVSDESYESGFDSLDIFKEMDEEEESSSAEGGAPKEDEPVSALEAGYPVGDMESGWKDSGGGWPSQPGSRRKRARRRRALQLFFGASVFLALLLGLFGGYYFASRADKQSVESRQEPGGSEPPAANGLSAF